MQATDSCRRPFRPTLALLAAATCWAGSAQAQTSTEIYGVIDMDVGSFRDSGGSRSSQVASGKLQTSYLGFKGTEDLGGGLNAFFSLESHLRIDTGEPGRSNTDPFFSRNAYVGLQSRTVGAVILGRFNTPFWLSAVATNPFGSSTGFSPGLRTLFGATGKTGGDGVWNNSIVYQSPRIAGANLLVQHQMKESGRGGNTGANVNYTAGPLVLTAAAQSVEVPYVVKGKETAGLLGAAYNFGLLRAFGQYARVKEDDTGTATANTRDKSWQLGASIPVGPVAAVLASYAQVRTSGALNGNRRFLTLGYDYRLSKRTELYTILMTDKNNSQSRGNTYSVGVRHAF